MKNTSPDVDAYIDNAADFAKPILKKLRKLFHQACPEIRETIKWSSPFFEYEGILEKAGNTEMSVLKASSVADLPADEILIQYIREAVDLNVRGVKIPRPKREESSQDLEIPNDLEQALSRNAKALASFEAKRETTRLRRLQTAVEWLSEGKPRNWKYMKGWR